MITEVPHDTSVLLTLLRDGLPHTRGELARTTGWARGTVTARLEALMEARVVREVDGAVSTGGRPSSRYAIDDTARCVIGVDLRATSRGVGVANLLGQVIAGEEHPISIDDGPEPVLTGVVEAIERLLATSGHGPDTVLAVGMGLPAPVDHELGRPAYPALMPGWDGFAATDWLQDRLGVPVLVDNVANLLALGERATSWPVDDLIFVTVGRGIGSGVVSGGRLLEGARGIAGDIGHVRVSHEPQLLCHCGNQGCLETVVAGPAIEARLREQGVPFGPGETLTSLMQSGQPEAVDAVRQAGREIGDVLAAAVNILNPSVILVGGSVAQAGEYLLAGIRETVYARAMPLATRRLTVARATTRDAAGVAGASRFAIDHVLGTVAAR